MSKKHKQKSQKDKALSVLIVLYLTAAVRCSQGDIDLCKTNNNSSFIKFRSGSALAVLWTVLFTPGKGVNLWGEDPAISIGLIRLIDPVTDPAHTE
jgi:uncharacterized membrane protein (DUF441 family)